jgi:hypothetical protein
MCRFQQTPRPIFSNLTELRYGECLALPSCDRPVPVGAEAVACDGVPFLSPGISNISGLKARNLKAIAEILVRHCASPVTETKEELLFLPGVEQKTATLVCNLGASSDQPGKKSCLENTGFP